MQDVQVVLYDGDCGLCARFAAWLEERDTAVAPIASETGERHLRDLSRGRRDTSIHVIDRDGRRRSGVEALAMLARGLEGWGWAARVVDVAPGPSSRAYAAIAARRALLSRALGVDGCRAAPDRRS